MSADNPAESRERMVSFRTGGHRFNLRAAAVIIEDGYALLHRLEDEPVWALPGGRVELGESAASAVAREMLEEANEHIEGGELLFVVENFFEYDGTPQHEVGLYFRSALQPESRLHDKTVSHKGTESGKALEFCWFQLTELEGVNLHPAFLREALVALPDAVRHVVQRAPITTP
ncbi:NUDIX domain-containing protein [Paucibacter sp. R3-3]|uniref:NUDIX domain-containing protein n=1 Tax=Roseateles agri TaxID=3098619 RepID=A0ABU5DK51_9BURK|nr:NUDIX domain-containing protein [Paucibacter sp. R3-3]MDY0746678.1 NUDIX domain-containing protein [Paucibacter sp. R3-3]